MNIFELLKKKSIAEPRNSGEFSGTNSGETPVRPALKVVGKSASLPCEKCQFSELDENCGIRWCCATPGMFRNTVHLVRCPPEARQKRAGKMSIVEADVVPFNPDMIEHLGCKDCDSHVDGWCLLKKPGSRYNIMCLERCPRAV